MFADGRPPFNLQSEHVRSVWELVRGSGLFFSPVILGDSEFVELLLDLSNEPDFDAWYTQVNPNAGEWLQRNEPGIANKSHIPLLKRVKSRVRAIYSREDRLFSRAQMDEIADVLGAGRFSYIDGSGHYVYLEKRREFCEVLSRHLDAM
jgi:pimeloyl-ACP methyl ester carboxylesterase